MKKETILSVVILTVASFFVACESDVEVKIGEEFKIDENPITILKFEERAILRSEKKKTIKRAPKGKKYIYFEVKNPNNEMIFLKVFSKDKELSSATNLYNYEHDIDNGFNDNYYLVDNNQTIDKIAVKGVGDASYFVNNPTITKSKTADISKEVQKLVASYTKKKAIGLLTGFKPFLPEGKNIFDVAFQKGVEFPTNILCNHAEVTYFTTDGKKYIIDIKDVFGDTNLITSFWDKGKVTRIEVKPLN